jgi:chitinase
VLRRAILIATALLVVLPVAGACTGAPAEPTAPTAGRASKVVGYFTDWGVYGRDYQVKDVETSGAASKLTHLVYAFGEADGGRCSAADGWADYQKPISGADSVDGAADRPDALLRGNFGQLRKLKAKHPGLKVLWSFGGWTGSGGFGDAARDPARFAASCRALLTDQRWNGLFDGIDVDWEYPNACGLTCDESGRAGLAGVLAALRAAFGANALVTAAVPGDVGKLTAADYAAAAKSASWLSAMTYDYFGTAGDDGDGDDTEDARRAEPHSPLTAYPGIPHEAATTTATIDKLIQLGVPPGQVLLGIGFYGRGWTGVTGSAPGAAASGPAAGRYEKGIEDYGILARRCPPTGTVGGTAYAHCGQQWWSFDTPETIKTKMAYARSRALGGAFAWELSGDTSDAALLTAIAAP